MVNAALRVLVNLTHRGDVACACVLEVPSVRGGDGAER
jgi:hypothetical protein